jgi:uncharacterized membrane protein
MVPMSDELPKAQESSGPPATSNQIAEITAEVTSLVISQVSRFFAGPLPPPDILARYNEAFGGAAERIVAMAERQSIHRQELESRVVESNCSNERLGQIIGATIAVLSLVIGGGLLALDKSIAGFGVIGTSTASLVGVFLYSRNVESKERADKMKSMLDATGMKKLPQP